MGRESRRQKRRKAYVYYHPDGRREEIIPDLFANVERLIVPGHPDHFLVKVAPSTPQSRPHTFSVFQGAEFCIAQNFVTLLQMLGALGNALILDEPPNPLSKETLDATVPKQSGLIDPHTKQQIEHSGSQVPVYNSPLVVEVVDEKGNRIEVEDEGEEREPEESDFASAHGGVSRPATVLDFPGPDKPAAKGDVAGVNRGRDEGRDGGEEAS